MARADLIERLRAGVIRTPWDGDPHAEGFDVDAEATNALLVEAANALAQRAGGWLCFYCGEHFSDTDSAAAHFGTRLHPEPACTIDAAEYRRMEAKSDSYAEEDAAIHRLMRKQETEHALALRREEERGYARGLSDARAGGCEREGVPLVQATAPERIFLQVGDEDFSSDEEFPDLWDESVTWSTKEMVSVCVPYVRADLAALRAADEAERGGLRVAVAWVTADDVRDFGCGDGCSEFRFAPKGKWNVPLYDHPPRAVSAVDEAAVERACRSVYPDWDSMDPAAQAIAERIARAALAAAGGEVKP